VTNRVVAGTVFGCQVERPEDWNWSIYRGYHWKRQRLDWFASRCGRGHAGMRAHALDLHQDIFFDVGRQPVFLILDEAVVFFDDPSRRVRMSQLDLNGVQSVQVVGVQKTAHSAEERVSTNDDVFHF
jgi:hypothetical protein